MASYIEKLGLREHPTVAWATHALQEWQRVPSSIAAASGGTSGLDDADDYDAAVARARVEARRVCVTSDDLAADPNGLRVTELLDCIGEHAPQLLRCGNDPLLSETDRAAAVQGLPTPVPPSSVSLVAEHHAAVTNDVLELFRTAATEDFLRQTAALRCAASLTVALASVLMEYYLAAPVQRITTTLCEEATPNHRTAAHDAVAALRALLSDSGVSSKPGDVTTRIADPDRDPKTPLHGSPPRRPTAATPPRLPTVAIAEERALAEESSDDDVKHAIQAALKALLGPESDKSPEGDRNAPPPLMPAEERATLLTACGAVRRAIEEVLDILGGVVRRSTEYYKPRVVHSALTVARELLTHNSVVLALDVGLCLTAAKAAAPSRAAPAADAGTPAATRELLLQQLRAQSAGTGLAAAGRLSSTVDGSASSAAAAPSLSLDTVPFRIPDALGPCPLRLWSYSGPEEAVALQKRRSMEVERRHRTERPPPGEPLALHRRIQEAEKYEHVMHLDLDGSGDVVGRMPETMGSSTTMSFGVTSFYGTVLFPHSQYEMSDGEVVRAALQAHEAAVCAAVALRGPQCLRGKGPPRMDVGSVSDLALFDGGGDGGLADRCVFAGKARGFLEAIAFMPSEFAAQRTDATKSVAVLALTVLRDTYAPVLARHAAASSDAAAVTTAVGNLRRARAVIDLAEAALCVEERVAAEDKAQALDDHHDPAHTIAQLKPAPGAPKPPIDAIAEAHADIAARLEQRRRLLSEQRRLWTSMADELCNAAMQCDSIAALVAQEPRPDLCDETPLLPALFSVTTARIDAEGMTSSPLASSPTGPASADTTGRGESPDPVPPEAVPAVEPSLFDIAERLPLTIPAAELLSAYCETLWVRLVSSAVARFAQSQSSKADLAVMTAGRAIVDLFADLVPGADGDSPTTSAGHSRVFDALKAATRSPPAVSHATVGTDPTEVEKEDALAIMMLCRMVKHRTCPGDAKAVIFTFLARVKAHLADEVGAAATASLSCCSSSSAVDSAAAAIRDAVMHRCLFGDVPPPPVLKKATLSRASVASMTSHSQTDLAANDVENTRREKNPATLPALRLFHQRFTQKSSATTSRQSDQGANSRRQSVAAMDALLRSMPLTAAFPAVMAHGHATAEVAIADAFLYHPRPDDPPAVWRVIAANADSCAPLMAALRNAWETPLEFLLSRAAEVVSGRGHEIHARLSEHFAPADLQLLVADPRGKPPPKQKGAKLAVPSASEADVYHFTKSAELRRYLTAPPKTPGAVEALRDNLETHGMVHEFELRRWSDRNYAVKHEMLRQIRQLRAMGADPADPAHRPRPDIVVTKAGIAAAPGARQRGPDALGHKPLCYLFPDLPDGAAVSAIPTDALPPTTANMSGGDARSQSRAKSELRQRSVSVSFSLGSPSPARPSVSRPREREPNASARPSVAPVPERSAFVSHAEEALFPALPPSRSRHAAKLSRTVLPRVVLSVLRDNRCVAGKEAVVAKIAAEFVAMSKQFPAQHVSDVVAAMAELELKENVAAATSNQNLTDPLQQLSGVLALSSGSVDCSEGTRSFVATHPTVDVSFPPLFTALFGAHARTTDCAENRSTAPLVGSGDTEGERATGSPTVTTALVDSLRTHFGVCAEGSGSSPATDEVSAVLDAVLFQQTSSLKASLKQHAVGQPSTATVLPHTAVFATAVAYALCYQARRVSAVTSPGNSDAVSSVLTLPPSSPWATRLSRAASSVASSGSCHRAEVMATSSNVESVGALSSTVQHALEGRVACDFFSTWAPVQDLRPNTSHSSLTAITELPFRTSPIPGLSTACVLTTTARLHETVPGADPRVARMVPSCFGTLGTLGPDVCCAVDLSQSETAGASSFSLANPLTFTRAAMLSRVVAGCAVSTAFPIASSQCASEGTSHRALAATDVPTSTLADQCQAQRSLSSATDATITEAIDTDRIASSAVPSARLSLALTDAVRQAPHRRADVLRGVVAALLEALSAAERSVASVAVSFQCSSGDNDRDKATSIEEDRVRPAARAFAEVATLVDATAAVLSCDSAVDRHHTDAVNTGLQYLQELLLANDAAHRSSTPLAQLPTTPRHTPRPGTNAANRVASTVTGSGVFVPAIPRCVSDLTRPDGAAALAADERDRGQTRPRTVGRTVGAKPAEFTVKHSIALMSMVASQIRAAALVPADVRCGITGAPTHPAGSATTEAFTVMRDGTVVSNGERAVFKGDCPAVPPPPLTPLGAVSSVAFPTGSVALGNELLATCAAFVASSAELLIRAELTALTEIAADAHRAESAARAALHRSIVLASLPLEQSGSKCVPSLSSGRIGDSSVTLVGDVLGPVRERCAAHCDNTRRLKDAVVSVASDLFGAVAAHFTDPFVAAEAKHRQGLITSTLAAAQSSPSGATGTSAAALAALAAVFAPALGNAESKAPALPLPSYVVQPSEALGEAMRGQQLIERAAAFVDDTTAALFSRPWWAPSAAGPAAEVVWVAEMSDAAAAAVAEACLPAVCNASDGCDAVVAFANNTRLCAENLLDQTSTGASLASPSSVVLTRPPQQPSLEATPSKAARSEAASPRPQPGKTVPLSALLPGTWRGMNGQQDVDPAPLANASAVHTASHRGSVLSLHFQASVGSPRPTPAPIPMSSRPTMSGLSASTGSLPGTPQRGQMPRYARTVDAEADGLQATSGLTQRRGVLGLLTGEERPAVVKTSKPKVLPQRRLEMLWGSLLPGHGLLRIAHSNTLSVSQNRVQYQRDSSTDYSGAVSTPARGLGGMSLPIDVAVPVGPVNIPGTVLEVQLRVDRKAAAGFLHSHDTAPTHHETSPCSPDAAPADHCHRSDVLNQLRAFVGSPARDGWLSLPGAFLPQDGRVTLDLPADALAVAHREEPSKAVVLQWRAVAPIASMSVEEEHLLRADFDRRARDHARVTSDGLGSRSDVFATPARPTETRPKSGTETKTPHRATIVTPSEERHEERQTSSRQDSTLSSAAGIVVGADLERTPSAGSSDVSRLKAAQAQNDTPASLSRTAGTPVDASPSPTTAAASGTATNPAAYTVCSDEDARELRARLGWSHDVVLPFAELLVPLTSMIDRCVSSSDGDGPLEASVPVEVAGWCRNARAKILPLLQQNPSAATSPLRAVAASSPPPTAVAHRRLLSSLVSSLRLTYTVSVLIRRAAWSALLGSSSSLDVLQRASPLAEYDVITLLKRCAQSSSAENAATDAAGDAVSETGEAITVPPAWTGTTFVMAGCPAGHVLLTTTDLDGGAEPGTAPSGHSEELDGVPDALRAILAPALDQSKSVTVTVAASSLTLLGGVETMLRAV